MIRKITMDGVACYKHASFLKTDKKVNLIYGLNGSGKSTLSNYMYNRLEERYQKCSIEPNIDESDEEILVYNRKFIDDYFYNSETQKGIFSLSKENKEAKVKIDNAQKLLDGCNQRVEFIIGKNLELNKNYEDDKEQAQNTVFNIKRQYSGGERILEFCLTGYKRSGADVLTHLLDIPLLEPKFLKKIEDIKSKVKSLSELDIQQINEIPTITSAVEDIEQENIWQKAIVGNKNSTISDLIDALGNADWVKNGLSYIKKDSNGKTLCPFCQQETISDTFIDELKRYFDKSYDEDIASIDGLRLKYKYYIEHLTLNDEFENWSILSELKSEYKDIYNKYKSTLESNLREISKKTSTPALSLKLISSHDALVTLNAIIEKANALINTYINEVRNKGGVLDNLKVDFWNLMRSNYDQTISNILIKKEALRKQLESNELEIQKIKSEGEKYQDIISVEQKNVITIETAIKNINDMLIDLGIDDFKIEKCSDQNEAYRITRKDDNKEVFRSLSEGEKMLISFLYFIEECKGREKADSLIKKRVIVIDDPISSLSHIHIFNIGRLIQNDFLRSDKYEQIFILTHSLYFFYELADTKEERRDKNQKLFRIQKNNEGSNFIEMEYEEIQNDYQAYWYIIKDPKQSPALIANCMRNIVDYFFNFVEKKDFNKVFQKPVLQNIRFQAFNRYMNRESHSLGENIFDIKEFDYDDFKDAFKLLFKECGYEEHYNRMIR